LASIDETLPSGQRMEGFLSFDQFLLGQQQMQKIHLEKTSA